MFSNVSRITITRTKITNAGRNITQRRAQEFKYPEPSEDVGTEGSSFEDFHGMTGSGTLPPASPEGDVTEGVGGGSLLEMEENKASVQLFSGAQDVHLKDTEILNAGGDVIIE